MHLAFTNLGAGAMSRAEMVKWIEAVAAEGGEGCRDWPWATNDGGYGAIRWRGRTTRVGHLTLTLSGSPRPDGAWQLHECDRPACAAPWHLRWGTAADNAADAVRRDRVAHQTGVTNANAKLTDSDVRAIRSARGRTQRQLGAEYGVHFTVIQKIRAGKIWRHLLNEDAA